MHEKVLLIDDDRALAEDLSALLRDEGYVAQLATSTSEALACAAADGFDVALIDVSQSHHAQDFDILPALRQRSAHGEIILMTDKANLHTALAALAQGAYGYLPKPFAAPQLLDLLKRALNQSALKREKHALSQRLAASEALYRGVVESVETAIVVLDESGVVRLANRFAHEALASSSGILAGHSFPALWSRPARAERAIARAAAGAVVTDVEGLHADSAQTRTVRWTFMSLAPPRLTLDPHAPATVLAVGLDVTERLAAEKRHAEAEALSATGTLATSLAHEIRNPLNAATLQLQLLKRRMRRMVGAEAADQLDGPVERVRTELTRLSSLLEDFLQLARPRLPAPALCVLAPLAQGVLELESRLASRSSIALSSHVAPELTARVDADKLKQALLNLVRNAIEAIGTRGGEVVISAVRDAGGVVIRVGDDGPGIPEQVRDTALHPFVTTKPGGTGLGLAIVQKVVAQHGGQLAMAAREGGGTVVSMRFPD